MPYSFYCQIDKPYNHLEIQTTMIKRVWLIVYSIWIIGYLLVFFLYMKRRDIFTVGSTLLEKDLEASKPHVSPNSFSLLSTCSGSETSFISAILSCHPNNFLSCHVGLFPFKKNEAKMNFFLLKVTLIMLFSHWNINCYTALIMNCLYFDTFLY